MKVVHFLDRMFCGGGQKHVLLLCVYLKFRGITSSVVCTNHDPYASEFKRADVDVRVVRFTDLPGIMRAIRENGADIIHAHGVRFACILGVLRTLISLPVVYTLHGYHGRQLCEAPHGVRLAKFRLRKYIEKRIYAKVDKIICVSEGDRKLVTSIGLTAGNKCQVIHNGIEISRFRVSRDQGARRATGILGHGPVITCVARFAYPKGHKYLIQALPLVLERYPEATLVLVGDGECQRAMEILAYDELALGRDQVQFLGRRSDIPSVLAASDIFVLPSIWEGLPLALIEAMAAGLPQVATDIDGNREVTIDGRTGSLVSPQDVIQLAEGVIGLLADGERRRHFSRNSVRRAAKLFDVNLMADRTAELYSGILANRIEASGRP